jgi:hypothetical protein
VDAVLVALGVPITTAGGSLLVLSWRRRAVLAGVCAAPGISLPALTVVLGFPDGARDLTLIMALIAVMIGTVLFALGQTLQRMLDTEPEADS